MHLRAFLGLVISLTLSGGLAPVTSADPPDHAPAHGYRAKRGGQVHAPTRESGGLEVMFDSERGIYVAVGLPGVLFHEGHYYREYDGRWQVSLSGNGGWSFAASGSIPEIVVKSKKRPSGPAKAR